MTNPNDIKIIRKYTNKQYGTDITIHDCENKNQQFDIFANDRNLLQRIEYKNRMFKVGTKRYLEENDILIELIQTTSYFLGKAIPTNENVSQLYNAEKINVAIGWLI